MGGPCQECGAPDAPFGYGPPGWPEDFWRCAQHQLEGPVEHPVDLELGPNQIERSDYCGNKRQDTAIARGLRDNNLLDADEAKGRRLHIVGARCECATWKYLKPIHWNWFLFDITDKPDLEGRGISIEVKGAEEYDAPTLIVPPKQSKKPPLEWAYVLVNAKRHPIYQIVGWRWGYEFLDDDHWDTVALKKRPAWRALPPYRPPSDLLALVREKDRQ